MSPVNVFSQPRVGRVTVTLSNTHGVCTKPEADATVDVLDLKTCFRDQNFAWTLPTKLDITDSLQTGQGTDSIEISFPNLQPLVRDAFAKAGISFDLDGDFDANMANSMLTDAEKDSMWSVKGGGFIIDSIRLDFTDGEASSIVINGTRVPKDIMPSRIADGMEWYRPSQE